MIRRLASAALAALALGAAVAVVLPQHAASLALLAAGTVTVVAATFLLLLAGPLVTADRPTTPLDGERAAGAPTLEPQGLRDARRDLAARVAPGSVPAGVRDRLAAAGVVVPSEPPAAGARPDAPAVAALVEVALDHPDHPDHLAPHGGTR